MAADINPYAPPGHDDDVPATAIVAASDADEDEDEDEDEPGYWRDGDLLIVENGARLPKRVCLWTGKRASGSREHTTLCWLHPGIAALLFLFLSPLGLWLGWIALRRSIRLHHGLSDSSRARVADGRTVVRASVGVGVAGSLLGLGVRMLPLALLSPPLLLLGVLVGRRMSRVAPVAWIHEGEAGLWVGEAVFEALGLDEEDD